MRPPSRMSPGSRLALAIVLTISLLAMSAVAAVAAVVYSAGTVNLEVSQPGGEDFSLTLPGILINFSLALVPDEIYAECGRELRPWLPLIREIANELDRCPDVVFVEVHDGDERVVIAKRSNALVVEVDGDDGHVSIKLPMRAVSLVASKLERGSRG